MSPRYWKLLYSLVAGIEKKLLKNKFYKQTVPLKWVKIRPMSVKKYFRYKKGSTEIESDNANKGAVRLAYINTIMYWLVRIILILIGSGTTIKFLIKLINTG